MTSTAADLNAIAERIVRDHDATAAFHAQGAGPDKNGIGTAQWLASHEAKIVAVRNTAKRWAETGERLEKAVRPARLAPLSKTVREHVPDVVDLEEHLAKAWDGLEKLRADLSAEVPAMLALVKRLDDWLAAPQARFGEPGVPLHLVGRAITASTPTWGSA
jgi:hypothetical protein